MIYLKNITEPQTISIPRVFMGQTGVLTLTLRNTVSNQQIVISAYDSGTYDLYYSFDIELPEDAAEGEWQYTLSDNDNLLASGIAVIGMDEVKYAEYTKKVEYEQYKKE